LRDQRYEDEFLAEVEREMSRQFGIPPHGFADRVKHRLAVGADRYGDFSFWRKDVVAELLEETPDVGAYAALEVQKRLLGGEDDGTGHYWLFRCAVYAAAADYCARMARRKAD
jgi:hypothetical protein